MSQFDSDFLKLILGAQLSSVEFVMDYVQLHFDGPTLTVYFWPVVKRNGNISRFGEPDYRDELCGRIGHKVVSAFLREDEAIDITFDDRAEIHISLRPEDVARLPEAGYFNPDIHNRKGPGLVF
jgi:hypothetical protein